MSDELEKYEFHPAANIMPLLEGKDFEDLVESIITNGQREPIDLLDGKIIDGRNRYRACIEAGVEPDFYDEKEIKIEDPIQFVLDKNLHRRHLTTAQRAMIAARVKDHYAVEAKERQKAGGGDKKSGKAKLPEPVEDKGQARDQAGAVLGVSGRSVDHASAILKHGDAGLIRLVDTGKISLNAAANRVPGYRRRSNQKKSSSPIKKKEPKGKWSTTETERRELVESGKTVVANYKTDIHLIAWASNNGLLVSIGRPSQYGNPFVIDDDGNRDEVCDKYEVYFREKTKLFSSIEDLKGKVLGCYCHPERCHGDYLAELANSDKKEIHIRKIYNDKLPPLSKWEFETLQDSIETHGQLDPIHVDENGDILDGWYRYKILGEKVATKTIYGLTETEKRAYGIRIQNGRRNESPAQKKELMREAKKIARKLSNEHPFNSASYIGAIFGYPENWVIEWLGNGRKDTPPA